MKKTNAAPAPSKSARGSEKTNGVAARPSPEAIPLKELTPRFEAEERELLRKALQTTVFDLLGLQLVAKQAHWNLVGPGFKPVHEFLDEIHEHAEHAADEAAERLVALGMSVEGQAPEIAASSRVETIPSGFVRDQSALRMMADRLKRSSDDIREGMEPIEEADTVTADLLHGILEVIEKDLWMARAHLI